MTAYAKTVADMLTTTRFLISLWIAWLGILGGRDALPTAMIALILAWGLQAPPSGKMLLVALQEVPIYGALAVDWIGLTVVITWPRLHRETVPQFLGGMRDLRHRLK